MSAENSIDIPEKLIDVESVIASKNPALLKILPGFVLKYLKRIIHQDAVNGYIYRNRDKYGLPFVDAILKEFGVNSQLIDATGHLQHTLSSQGRFIIASNHPLGALDGMAMMHTLGSYRQDLVFPVNDLLMNVPGLRPLFIPINKHGRNTENARLIDETFASDKVILYFPAGLVSRKFKGNVIRDLEWKNTFIKKARKYKRDIIPVYIEGRNSDWFYGLSRWRKRFGIKANLEMLYLVDEMVRQLGKTITIITGEPIPWTTFDKSRSDAQWAEWVKEKSYALAASFRHNN